MTTARALTEPIGLADVQTLVQDALREFFNDRCEAARQIDPHYHTLWQSLSSLGLSGGKRIRPYIIMLTYQGLTDDPVESILPIAVSQELLHLAMLIHDDIVDRDSIRYGVPNISGRYEEYYSPFLKDPDERRHFADGSALIAGDLIISSAYAYVLGSNLKAEKKSLAQRILTDAIFNVTAGQLLDTEATFRPFSDSDALKISMYKTATYSFIGPLTIAARLAGATAMTIDSLTQLGRYLGIAYQVTDDVLGVFGDETTTGKSASGDLREGKHTYLIEQFYLLADSEQRTKFNALFGKGDLTSQEAEILRTLLIATGARQRAEELAVEYAQKAQQILANIGLKEPQKRALSELIDLCTTRRA